MDEEVIVIDTEFDGGLMFGNDMAALYADLIMNWIRKNGWPAKMCYWDIAIAQGWTNEQLQQGLKRIEDHFEAKLPEFRTKIH